MARFVRLSPSSITLATLLVATAGATLLAWAGAGFGRLARVAGLIALIALLVWRDASFFALAMDERGLWTSVLAPGASRFLQWMAIFGIPLTAAGLAGLVRGRDPVAWASLAAGAPVLYLAGAWARVPDLLPDPA